MSERYPVGTKVQVTNGGLGSRFRNEDERVGEFAGTVIATSGSSYTGIPEVCVESETGERRMIMVGDLEEAPAAEPVSTLYAAALQLEKSAADARALAEQLTAMATEARRTYEIALRTVDGSDCGRQVDPKSIINEVRDMRPIVCAREQGHRGLHRDTVAIHRDTYKWGDDVCLPVDPGTCGARETDTGYGYQCTLSGPHTQHQAHGLENQVFYSWPVDTARTVD